jgi:4-hydroxybenzoate polyprenyltransferase
VPSTFPPSGGVIRVLHPRRATEAYAVALTAVILVRNRRPSSSMRCSSVSRVGLAYRRLEAVRWETTALRRSLPTTETGRGIKRVLLDLWRLGRPMMWLIPLVPFGLGHLMASRQPGAGQGLCFAPTVECATAILPLLAGIVVWGPLSCSAVLAINDAYDIEGDSLNPRKVGSPVASGRFSARSAFIIAHVEGALAVVVAAVIRPMFGSVTFLALALGWLYSVPPVRLKVRPGFDVAINAVGNGGLSIMAGWTSARSIDEFPWIVFVLACSAAAALYLPTTVLDYQSDLAANYSTVAIRLGPRAVHRIGLGFWIVAGVGCLVLAAKGIVLPQRSVWVLVVSVPALIGLYHWAFRRVREQRESLAWLGIVGFGSLAPLLVIVLMYADIV